MKVLVRTVSSVNSGGSEIWRELCKTDGWQTLMTFTRENTRTYLLICLGSIEILLGDKSNSPADKAVFFATCFPYRSHA